MEFSEEDRQLIKSSAPLIMEHVGRLTDHVYDHLLEYPQARKFFVTEQDEPDPARPLDVGKLVEGVLEELVLVAEELLERPGCTEVDPEVAVGLAYSAIAGTLFLAVGVGAIAEVVDELLRYSFRRSGAPGPVPAAGGGAASPVSAGSPVSSPRSSAQRQ